MGGMTANRNAGILDGLRVVEISAFVAAPLGGMTLAQLGAEVIRVDPPGGGPDFHRWPVTADGVSLYWAGLNKGKRSVAIDPSAAEGRRLIRRLIAAPGPQAGILITNLSPRWLDYRALQQERPDLIMVALSGNPDGSRAVDYTVNAAAGYPALTGPGPEPVNHVLPAWDVIAGHMIATAVLAAERRRARTGQGTLVNLSLADAAFATVAHLGQIGEAVVGGGDRPRYGNYLFGSYGRDFPTADGSRLMVVALTPRQWSALTAATETGPALARLEEETGADFREEGDRFAAREPISDLLAPWFAARTRDEAGTVLDRHGACWGPYRTVRQLAEEDPRLDPERNPMWSIVRQPGIGDLPSPATPLDFAGVPRPPAAAAPLLGADTRAALAEMGLDEGELDRLQASGIIACPDEPVR